MSEGTARSIKPILYIEGKRLDNALISYTTSAAIGRPSTAAISLVPTDTIRHIFPRTYIHLYTTDPWDDSGGDPVLLFEGEVLGTGFSRTESGRAFVIHCADVSNYWHHVRQYWFNLTQSGGNFLDQFIRMTTAGAARIETTAPFGVKEYVIQKINMISSEENLFLDSMIALLDDIGNISAFYHNARRRLRITDRISRSSSGQVQNLLQLSFMSDWLQQLISARSGETNLLTIISLLMNIIYHEYVPVLAPPFIKSQTIKRDALGNPVFTKDKKSMEMIDQNIVGSFVFKPHIYTIPPPTFNVLFPEMYSSIQYDRNFSAETTRMTLTPQVVEKRGGGPLSILRQKVFKRPMELDTFYEMYTAGHGTNSQTAKRPAKAKYGDGRGQSGRVQEWEFFTNEERFKGINPSFEKLAPAPAIMSLQNQGKVGSKGQREGGSPQYVHNVASYEFTAKRFASRRLSVTGVYNIRPVPGYPMLIVDDSDARMNFIAYLNGITHSGNAAGNATTSYALSHPRDVEEVDLNRPILFKDTGKFDFDKDGDEQVFDFERMFTPNNQPPIPDWFDDNYKTIGGLSVLYKDMFGGNATSVEDINREFNVSLKGESKDDASDTKSALSSGTECNSHMVNAVKLIIDNYRMAKKAGKEFSYISEYTDRSFTSPKQAFRFLGASPKNATKSYEPVADTDYIGDHAIRAFTVAEIDPTGESKDMSTKRDPVYNGKLCPHPFEMEIYNKSVELAKKSGVTAGKSEKTKGPEQKKNAPTGANITVPEPVSHPLSEEQIIRARRSVINKYRKEISEKRGFRG